MFAHSLICRILAFGCFATLAGSAAFPVLAQPGIKAERPRLQLNDSRALERFKQRSWWNQPQIVEALALSEEQREQLDQLLEAAIETRSQGERERRRVFDEFAQSLETVDRDTQARLVEQMAKSMGDLAIIRAEFMMDGLALLSSDQRKQLAEEYPQLLRRDWLGGTMPGNGRVGMRPRSRAGAGAAQSDDPP